MDPKAFEQQFGVRYQSTLEIAPAIEPALKRSYERSNERDFFNEERHWLGKLHRDEILSGHVASVVIAHVDETFGYGLFAAKDFEPCEYIGIYAGKIERRGLLRFNSNDYCFRYPCAYWTPRPLMIDAGSQGNETRFINHSDTPNLEGMGVPVDGIIYVLFRTNRPVQKGEQLTYDYGASYWRGIGRKKAPSNPLKISL